MHRGRAVLAMNCVLGGAQWRRWSAAQLGRCVHRIIKMSSISKTKLAHILWCIALSILGSLVLADVNATAYEGKIFINLCDSDDFSEYELAAGNLVKTIDGKVSRFEKDGRSYITSETEDFKRTYNSKRIYRYDMEEKQAAFFSPYDLQRLENIQSRFFRHTLFGEEPEFMTGNLYL